MVKYSSDSEEISDSSENFHIVPSSDGQDIVQQVAVEEIAQELESTDTEEETPSSPNPVIMFFFKTIKLMLLPFCKIFFAPTAQRTFVKTTILGLTISYIAATSLFAYILFYNKYIPPITHVKPIWFHYTPDQGPQAVVNIATRNSRSLRHDQVYDVSVQLKVPTSDTNFGIGNFMIDVQLQTNNGSTIKRSSRPAILRYQSRAQRMMRVFAKAIPLLVGLSEESQIIETKLIDSFTETKNQAVSQVGVSISDPRIQIYDAKLLILAKFYGLRYFMYFHRFTTGFVFVLLFSVIEFICAAIAWKGFGESLWNRLYQSFVEQERSVSDMSETFDELQSVSGTSEKSD